MKRICILFVLLFSLFATSHAQHKALKHIELSDVYISQSGSEKSYNIGNTKEIYSSYFYLGQKRIEHQKGVKDYDLGYDLWCIQMRLDSYEAIAIELYSTMEEAIGGLYSGTSELIISVGGQKYNINSWYYTKSDRYLMLDINKNISQHISVSGLQGIETSEIEIIAFTDIEQELWRRAAKDVYETRNNM